MIGSIASGGNSKVSRIRSVHPGFFKDERLVECSAFARLLFIGLGVEADDKGIFEWKPVTLKMTIFPGDNLDVSVLLAELASADAIRMYEVAGRKYGAIRNFRKFQKPKTPNDVHPMPPEIGNYVALSAATSETDGDQPPPFPQKVENTFQMEDGGGRMEDEGESSAPHSEAAGARVDFEKLKAVFPINPKSNPDKAASLFAGLPASERAAVLASAGHFRQWFVEDNVARNRSNEEGRPYAPHLANWIRSGEWREASALPIKAINSGVSPDLVVLHADDPRFKAVQRARDRPIIVGKNGTATFTKSEVDAATAEQAA
jgi:hypothetical protein